MSASTLAERSLTLFERAGRSPGVRNHVLVIPSVICSHLVADTIADQVAGAVPASHDHGCAQIGEDKAATERTMINVATNPNVAGAVVVGLGCESVQSDDVQAGMEAAGLPVASTVIQRAGGTEEAIEEGIELARTFRERDGKLDRTSEATMRDLTVGIVIGDERPGTRDIAEPLVGTVVDRLVKGGADVVLAGGDRARTAPEDVQSRLGSSKAREAFEAIRNGGRRSFRPVADGMMENPFRAIGEQQIDAVVSYGAQADVESSVTLVDTSSAFAEAATALAAAGAHLIIHLTGEGVPTGHPIVPTIKVCGDAETVAAIEPDIDIDAREASPESVLDRICAVADGADTAAERHGVTDFGITRFGPSM